jgi:hypothetical protein
MLQENEAGGIVHGILNIGHSPSDRLAEDPLLPWTLADDDIDRPITPSSQPDHTHQRIVDVAGSDLDCGAGLLQAL